MKDLKSMETTMKKLIIVMGVAMAGVMAVSAAARKPRTPEEEAARAAARAEFLAKTGGMVTKEQRGNFVRVVSAQKLVGLDVIKAEIKELNKMLGLPFEVSEMNPGKCPISDAANAVKQPKTANVLLIVADDKLPTILSAPEQAWAILNVAKLNEDLVPQKVYDLRVKKELNRAVAAAFGVGMSMTPPSLMDPVYSKVDLDAIVMTELEPEALAKIQTASKMRGVVPVRRTTYKQAAIEGWAPAPTNDIQRAIMEEVKNPANKFKKDFPEFSGKGK